MTDSELIREAALSDSVRPENSGYLGRWLGGGPLYKALSFISNDESESGHGGLLSGLPDIEARRTFLLLVSEALK
ncbi:MAG: hypothetical protein H0X13_15620 [Ramlibacter sp.]|nr:hypothetical protein [Ramlibacter sp.]